ncbi:MAG: hypothetical protein PF961_19870 [Planctomycetota bacterium]|nr:hypothetical protein [Planctomycetota bacterium]
MHKDRVHDRRRGVREMGTAVCLVLVLMLLGACGRRSSAELIAPLDAAVSVRVDGNQVTVQNKTADVVRDVRVRCRFYQEEVLAHTMGHAQWYTPAGWYVSVITIDELAPAAQVERRVSFNIGPNSQNVAGW